MSGKNSLVAIIVIVVLVIVILAMLARANRTAQIRSNRSQSQHRIKDSSGFSRHSTGHAKSSSSSDSYSRSSFFSDSRSNSSPSSISPLKCPKNCTCLDCIIANKAAIKHIDATSIITGTLDASTITADNANIGNLISKCGIIEGRVDASVSLEKPCFTFGCDGIFNVQSIQYVREAVAGEGTAFLPFNDATPIDPPADEVCPEIDGSIAIDESLQFGAIILTNTSTPLDLSPEKVGPIYFEPEFRDDIPDSDKPIVLTIGCRDTWCPGSLCLTDNAPPGDGTTNQITMTFDGSVFPPGTTALSLELVAAVSGERGYEFFTLEKNGLLLNTFNGMGGSATNPYLRSTVNLTLLLDDELTITYTKDPAAYGGVDGAYFYVAKIGPVKEPDFPTTLTITRGEDLIKEYNVDVDLDAGPPIGSATKDCNIEIQAGDKLCLNADTETYDRFDVTVSYENITQIYNHRQKENFYAPVTINELAYNTRIPRDLSKVQGFYHTDAQFIGGIVFIRQISECPNGQEGLELKYYSPASSGPYYLDDHFIKNYTETWTKVDSTRYADPIGREFVFDPLTGIGKLDTSNIDNIIAGGTLTYLQPVVDEDERYWRYALQLKDPNAVFNEPKVFINFVKEYYKTGFIGSQFMASTYELHPDVNPYQLDLTQVRRAYGSFTKGEYDDLADRLINEGVTHEYNVSRLIYWPYPGSDLTEDQKAALRWAVNQNRYPFLAFAIDSSKFARPSDFTRICPGEDVELIGTGVEWMDGFAFRSIMDGYHGGPKPDSTQFMQTFSGLDVRSGNPIPSEYSFNLDKEWAFYTLDLPIVIDETNDTIYSRLGGLDYELSKFVMQLRFNNDDNYIINAQSSWFGENLILNPLTGSIVRAEPFDSYPFTNSASFAGKVVICQFGGPAGSSVKATDINDAGGIGVIFVGFDDGDNTPSGIFAGGDAPIPSASITYQDYVDSGLQSDVENDVPLTVDALFSPIYQQIIPHGRYYLTEIIKMIKAQFDAGDSNFFIDLGNYLTLDYGVNDIMALTGTSQGVLYGPDDANYPSSFFGPTGLDIGYLFADGPIVPELQGYYFLDATYAQLLPGTYKSHTPLTSAEVSSLLTALYGNEEQPATGITAKVVHGPMNYDMKYSNYVSIAYELSAVKNTEDHTVMAPWVHKSTNGMFDYDVPLREMLDTLKLIADQIDPTITYVIPSSDNTPHPGDELYPGYYPPPIPGVPYAATFAPTVYIMPIRTTLGHPGEFTELYNDGFGSRTFSQQSRGESRLEWISPEEYRFYPPGTITSVGDLSGREITIAYSSYLEEAFWMGKGVAMNGAPDFPLIPYTDHVPDRSSPDANPDVILGEWLIGILKADKVAEILDLSEEDEVPAIGYMTWYTSDFDSKGDETLLPWYDPNWQTASATAILFAATMISYWNSKNVKHIIFDVRNVVGGSDPVFPALMCLMGGKRIFSSTTIFPLNVLEPNGNLGVRVSDNFGRQIELEVPDRYLYHETANDCDFQQFLDAGLADVVPNPVWNSDVTGGPARLLWISGAAPLSNPEFRLGFCMGTSLDKTTFNGDFGGGVQFVVYGTKHKPFSTAGGYESILNYYGKDRVGSEEHRVPPIYALDRYEANLSGYIEGSDDLVGGVVKNLAQEFGPIQRVHIKSDMSASIFFWDIGFTIGNPGVDPLAHGEPWLPERYPDVEFLKPLTYRDTMLERVVEMIVDDNITDHFDVEDGYGYIMPELL